MPPTRQRCRRRAASTSHCTRNRGQTHSMPPRSPAPLAKAPPWARVRRLDGTHTHIPDPADKLVTDPFARFKEWFAEAQATEPADANAMTVATATPDGRPSARIVLLKGVDPR